MATRDSALLEEPSPSIRVSWLRLVSAWMFQLLVAAARESAAILGGGVSGALMRLRHRGGRILSACGICVLVAALFPPCLVRGDPGLALGYPVSGIQIDGDLSDWPEHLPRYPINFRCLGEPPADPQDCSAEFRVGYSEVENALYVALEVQDEERAAIGNRPLVLFTDELAMVMIGIDTEEGGHLRLGFLRGESITNTCPVQGEGNCVYHDPVHFRAEMQRRESGWRYEFRIDVQSMTHGQARLRPGGRVELNVWIHDADRCGSEPPQVHSKVLAWVEGDSLRRRSGRGDLLLVGQGAAVGRLSGQVKLRGSGIPRTRKRVRIELDAAPRSVVRAFTERDGRFEVDLPAGRYRVAVDQRGAEARPVEIRGRAETRAELEAPRVVGQTVQAVPARVQSAGRGSRRGAWRTYGVADGLPAASVTAIVQDGQGELWLGTDGGGLARFDGARFYVYAMEEIVGGNRVARLLEDPAGRLWITAKWDQPGEGIAFLDQHRERFVTYTSQDGLQNGREERLVLDPQDRVCVTDDFGVARLDTGRGQFVHFSPEDGLPGRLQGASP